MIKQEKLNIYKQRQELELFKSNIVCIKCKEPVKDFGLAGTTMPCKKSFFLTFFLKQINK